MRKKLCSMLSTYWIAKKTKNKKQTPIASGFLPVWCGSFILLPTFSSFLMMSIYIDKGCSISVLIYRGC